MLISLLIFGPSCIGFLLILLTCNYANRWRWVLVASAIGTLLHLLSVAVVKGIADAGAAWGGGSSGGAVGYCIVGFIVLASPVIHRAMRHSKPLPTEGDPTEQTLIRFVRLRDDLKPLDYCISPTSTAISPDWLGVSRVCSRHRHRTDVQEDFILHYFMDDGRELTWEQYENLEIALDQAAYTVGVRRSEWRECCIPNHDDEQIPWSRVTQSRRAPDC